MQILASLAAVFAIVTSAFAAGVDELPADIAARYYAGGKVEQRMPLGASFYRNWKAKKSAPWTIGYVGSARFGSWNAAALEMARDKLAPKWASLGLAKPLIAPPAAGSDAEAGKQIRELADQGADAILVCCAGPDALNDAVRYAHDKGALVVFFFGFSTSPYALNATTNLYLAGTELVDRMAEQLSEKGNVAKGNVLVVGGFLRPEESLALDRGIRAGFASHSGLKLVGDIVVDGDADAARKATEAWLKAHRDAVDGVIVRSGADRGILDAFTAAVRKIPSISVGGDMAALCHWRQNLDSASHALIAWSPADLTDLAWNVAMRTLEGQGPKTQSILVDAGALSDYVARATLLDDCSESDEGWYSLAADPRAKVRALDNYFLRPSDPASFRP